MNTQKFNRDIEEYIVDSTATALSRIKQNPKLRYATLVVPIYDNIPSDLTGIFTKYSDYVDACKRREVIFLNAGYKNVKVEYKP